MAEIFKLKNQVKDYPWGSPYFIPRLLGLVENGTPYDDAPCAELWMGVHPGAPSQVILPDGNKNLGEFISRDPNHYLGEKTAKRYAALPYLFKLLAAQTPLSIQAHPNLKQAQEGFERENREGLSIDAPNRSYKDSNHKPEIICALTPFTGMCGFRSPEEIRGLLAAFLDNIPKTKGLAPLIKILEKNEKEILKDFLNELFNLSDDVRKSLTVNVLSIPDELNNSPEYSLMREFAQLYPEDPAVISPLYLNVFRLEPGEAIYLKAGLLHAYCGGFGVELMANSDNVLRGGLTGKHIDIPELMHVLDFNPAAVQIIKPVPGSPVFTYPAPCGEFSLTVIQNSGETETIDFSPEGPSIGIVTEGKLNINDMILKRGESVFIPPTAPGDNLKLQGTFTFHVASVGSDNAGISP